MFYLLGTPELDEWIPSRIRLLDNEDESLSETEKAIIDKPSRGYTHDVDWAPRSLYLQRKLQSDKATVGISYRIRSKGMSRSEPENDNVQSSASSDDSRPTPSHSYNLRARLEATQKSNACTYIPGFAVGGNNHRNSAAWA